MKKRQELASQMSIEAVKDVREQIGGCNFNYSKEVNAIHNSTVVLQNESFSIEYYLDYTGIYTTAITSAGQLFSSFGLMYGEHNKPIMIRLTNNSANIPCTDGAVVGLNHVVVVYNKSTLRAYVNGVINNQIQSDYEYIARLMFLNTQNLKHARIFNYALSTEEVAALYNNGKPEEYVIKETMKNISSIDFGTQITYFGTAFGGIVSNDTVNKVYTIDATNLYPDKDYATSYLYGFKFRDKVKYKFKVKIVSNKDFTTTIYPLVRNYQIKEGDNYIDITAESFNNNWFHIYPTRGVIITLSEFDIREVGCIAEYLPQNLISTNDGEMNATTATKWLDSAKQLPLNDEYLEPLLESIGGYDLTASGEPEIAYKPNVVQFWDLLDKMDVGTGASDLNTIATMDAITNGARLNYTSGGSIQYPRLRYPSIEDYNAIGKRIKIEYDYNVLYGNPIITRIETIGCSSISYTEIMTYFVGSGHKEHISTNLGITDSNVLRLDFGSSDEPYSIEITNVRVSYWNE